MLSEAGGHLKKGAVTPSGNQIKNNLSKPSGPYKHKIRLKVHKSLVLPPGESVFASQ